MKFIHLSDLHLGKRVNEYSMLEDQEYILKKSSISLMLKARWCDYCRRCLRQICSRGGGSSVV